MARRIWANGRAGRARSPAVWRRPGWPQAGCHGAGPTLAEVVADLEAEDTILRPADELAIALAEHHLTGRSDHAGVALHLVGPCAAGILGLVRAVVLGGEEGIADLDDRQRAAEVVELAGGGSPGLPAVAVSIIALVCCCISPPRLATSQRLSSRRTRAGWDRIFGLNALACQVLPPSVLAEMARCRRGGRSESLVDCRARSRCFRYHPRPDPGHYWQTVPRNHRRLRWTRVLCRPTCARRRSVARYPAGRPRRKDRPQSHHPPLTMSDPCRCWEQPHAIHDGINSRALAPADGQCHHARTAPSSSPLVHRCHFTTPAAHKAAEGDQPQENPRRNHPSPHVASFGYVCSVTECTKLHAGRQVFLAFQQQQGIIPALRGRDITGLAYGYSSIRTWWPVMGLTHDAMTRSAVRMRSIRNLLAPGDAK